VLSERTVYLRYLQPMMLQDRVMHQRLARICHCDYDRELALLAETPNEAGEQDIMGVVRLSKIHGTNEARLSILIGDPYQGIGLGSELVRRAIEIARSERLSGISAVLTTDNQAMKHIFETLNFQIGPTSDEKLLLAKLGL
jgi:acetyltransferase